MATKEIKQLLDFTTLLAIKTGEIQMKHFGKKHDIKYKGKRDLVTEVDKKCEQFIVDTILKTYPEHHILAEEGGGNSKDQSGYRWIIDPIDGTTNYSHAHPFFAVSIGLEIKGELAVGVVYSPKMDELFSAAKSMGAKLNGKKISVSKTPKLDQSLLATGFNPRFAAANIKHYKYFELHSQGIRRAGAASLDICHTACGRLDGYWEKGLKPWDVAGGALIALEAGARITNWQGKKFDPFSDEILISNGKIHNEMVKHFK